MAKEDVYEELYDIRYYAGRGAEVLGSMMRMDEYVTKQLYGKWRADLISLWIMFAFFAIGLMLDVTGNWSKDFIGVMGLISSAFFTVLAGSLIVAKQKRRP